MEYIENISDFLIAEYNALQERARKCEETKTSRINFYLIIVAASWASLASSAQLDFVQKNVLNIVILTEFIVLILGIATLYDLMNFSAAIVMFYRKAGRIRRWFVDLDKSICKYVAFHPTDDRPNFSPNINLSFSILSWRGAESILVIINSFSISIVFACLFSKISTTYTLITIITSFIIFILAWYLQLYFVSKQMKKQQKSEYQQNQINFPYEDLKNTDYNGFWG